MLRPKSHQNRRTNRTRPPQPPPPTTPPPTTTTTQHSNMTPFTARESGPLSHLPAPIVVPNFPVYSTGIPSTPIPLWEDLIFDDPMPLWTTDGDEEMTPEPWIPKLVGGPFH
ncbi:hypothetical protein Pelo_17030 [Pelomyxa schiedti]|nr:hypothetical protein Pelo_17030 [Pelomyxa schiedti]